MRNICKWATVHKGRVVLERLNKVRLHRVFQQHRHCAIRLDVTGIDRFTLAGIGDNHIAKTLLQIAQIAGQTQDRHDLGRDSDIKASFARETVGNAAQGCCDLAQRAVVHVDNAAPHDAAQVDLKRVTPIDVVINHRAKQVVRRRDRVEIACKVQVHFFHRHDLGIATASGPALHTKVRSQRCFADTDSGVLADAVQTIAQTNGGRCLAFACGRRVDRGHKDQLAIGAVLNRVDKALRDLRLVMPVWQQIVAADPQLCANLLNGFLGRFTRDLDVSFKGHGIPHSVPLRHVLSPAYSGPPVAWVRITTFPKRVAASCHGQVSFKKPNPRSGPLLCR